VSGAERPEAQGDHVELWKDRSAYRRLYAQDWAELCGFLRARFGGGPPDPEDVAQQAFLKLGEEPSDRRRESPRAFVFRVAINLTLDSLRHRKRAKRLLSASASSLEPDNDPDAERTLIAKDELKLLDRVVAGLPERHRLYLTANRVEGQSFAQIARRHGVSESLVRKTVEEAVSTCLRALTHRTIDYRGLSRERNRGS
jgi:RNA polymerase sigma factor (sigma-70 family)